MGTECNSAILTENLVHIRAIGGLYSTVNKIGTGLTINQKGVTISLEGITINRGSITINWEGITIN